MMEAFCKILVVEDSQINALVLNRHLEKHDALVDIVDSAEKAIPMLLNNYYDAALVDIELPKMSGLELTRWLRNHGYDRTIIAITSHKGLQKEAKEAGCDAYMTKPWTKHDLVNRINVLMLKKRKERVQLSCQLNI